MAYKQIIVIIPFIKINFKMKIKSLILYYINDIVLIND